MVEQPLLGWAGRFAYLTAKYEKDSIGLYAMDMIWLMAKRNYDGLKQPSSLYFQTKKTDRRGKRQIIADILKSLGGE